ncbi:MAG: discoidin domain-containing protein, partial [Planctomycetes bacterium]|nr:discoidin domain-containing protein [Planctomycetota bacterium]
MRTTNRVSSASRQNRPGRARPWRSWAGKVRGVLLIASILALLGSIGLQAVCAGDAKLEAAEPVISRQQIEADWLRQDEVRGVPVAPTARAKPEEDAVGGCDGVKNGKWGFHTEYEDNPWWQVDLQKATPLARMLLYNRCDIPDRAARLIVLLSDDGKQFKQAYQHDGTRFLGFTDNKPLVVELKGAVARYVRIQLPGKVYFHLDEVEIFPVGEDRNIALKKPATQSSTSTWSVAHTAQERPAPQKYSNTAKVVERGLRLAESLRRLGASVGEGERTLRRVAEQLSALAPDAPEAAKRDLYLEAHWAVRTMALANPLLSAAGGFDAILFVKSVPGSLPHMSDQFYGWF